MPPFSAPLLVASTVSSTLWFGPLATSRVYESAFTLGYTGVNQICLYSNLALLVTISLIFTAIKESANTNVMKAKVSIAHVFGLVGSLLLAFVQYMYTEA